MTDYKQSLIKDLVFNKNKNIFISGEAGTGKSFNSKLLKNIADQYEIEMHLTSTTGITAINIEGTTIHRWSGIRLGKESANNIVSRLMKNDKSCIKRWRETDILLIDEISLLGKKTLELLNEVAKIIRKNIKPFGGMQVIFTGDFLQLPPINDEYCFKSKVWDELDLSYVRLCEPKRYNDINHFYLLQRIRLSKHTKEDINILRDRLEAYYDYMRAGGDDNKNLSIKPTKITSLKNDVDKINQMELDKLDGDYVEYYSKDKFTLDKLTENKDNDDNKDDNKDEEFNNKKMKELTDFFDTIVDKTVIFKNKAQVMLNYNMDINVGLCNGARGVILQCEKDGVLVQFKCLKEPVKITPIPFEIKEGRIKMIRHQIPLIVAFAMTIHKSQGSSLDSAIINIGHTIFGHNMSYVALGRVKNLDGIYLSSFSPQKIIASEEAIKFEEEIIQKEIK